MEKKNVIYVCIALLFIMGMKIILQSDELNTVQSCLVFGITVAYFGVIALLAKRMLRDE